MLNGAMGVQVCCMMPHDGFVCLFVTFYCLLIFFVYSTHCQFVCLLQVHFGRGNCVHRGICPYLRSSWALSVCIFVWWVLLARLCVFFLRLFIFFVVALVVIFSWPVPNIPTQPAKIQNPSNQAHAPPSNPISQAHMPQHNPSSPKT